MVERTENNTVTPEDLSLAEKFFIVSKKEKGSGFYGYEWFGTFKEFLSVANQLETVDNESLVPKVSADDELFKNILLLSVRNKTYAQVIKVLETKEIIETTHKKIFGIFLYDKHRFIETETRNKIIKTLRDKLLNNSELTDPERNLLRMITLYHRSKTGKILSTDKREQKTITQKIKKFRKDTVVQTMKEAVSISVRSLNRRLTSTSFIAFMAYLKG